MGYEQLGRGRGGRSGGRGGRGRSNGRFNSRGRGSNGQNQSKGKDSEVKFAPQNSGKAPTATYSTVKEAIVNYVQKMYKNGQDVAKSLKMMRKVDLLATKPIQATSLKTDEKERELEQQGLNIKYQEELRRYMDRSAALNEGLSKAYALIFNNYCTKVMQN